MFKSGDTRLDETTTYIRNLATLDAGLRSRAADFMERYLNTHIAQKSTISTSLQIGDSSADPQQNRHARRAYVLLHKAVSATCVMALGTGLPPANIAIAPATAKLHLSKLVMWAAVLQDHETMSSYSMALVLRDLQLNPLTFLQNNPLIVYGSTRWDQTQGDRNVLPFYLSFDTSSLFRRYQFSVTALKGSAPIQVDSVVARWWTDIPGAYVKNGNTAHGNFSQLRGIELCSQVMVTTQFTGCAFAMKRANGHVYCAHTTPRAPMVGTTDVVRSITGHQLAQDVHSMNGVAGDFANAAGGNALSVYGAAWSHGIINGASYPDGLGSGNYMTIVGVQRGTNHEIYSQVTENQVVMSAQRIF